MRAETAGRGIDRSSVCSSGWLQASRRVSSVRRGEDGVVKRLRVVIVIYRSTGQEWFGDAASREIGCLPRRRPQIAEVRGAALSGEIWMLIRSQMANAMYQ